MLLRQTYSSCINDRYHTLFIYACAYNDSYNIK